MVTGLVVLGVLACTEGEEGRGFTPGIPTVTGGTDTTGQGDTGQTSPVTYELAPVTEVPGIPGQMDALVPATIQGEAGCLAVTAVPGDFLNPAVANISFVTPDGVSTLWSLELPNADQRAYASGAAYIDPSTQTTVVAIPYSSTEGFPSGADGTHHGIFLFDDAGNSVDLDLYALFGVTRPGQLSFVAEDPLLGNQIGLRVLFGNGDAFTSDGTKAGTVEDYFPPSVVTIPVAILEDGALQMTEDLLDTPTKNFHGFVSLGGGLFLAGAAGSTMGINTGPVDPFGALLTLDSDNNVVGRVDIESGLAMGPSAVAPDGTIYVSGWRPLDGNSLASIGEDGVEYHNLFSLTDNTFVQGMLALDNRVYVRVQKDGAIETSWFNPNDPSVTFEAYGDPIAAQWAHGFQLYGSQDGALLYCAGESATGIDPVDTRILTSTVSFHQAIPE